MPAGDCRVDVWERRGLLVAPPAGNAVWATHAQAPTVLPLAADCWRAYVGGRDGGNCSRVFCVDLDPRNDFRVLRVHAEAALDCGEPGAFDVHGVAPAAVLPHGGQVWLYYSGIAQRRDVPYQIAVGLAVSEDGGISFRRACPGPVMGPGPHDPYFVSSPSVWRSGRHFRAVYSSATQWRLHASQWECSYQLRGAASEDGVHWQIDADPALELAPGEAGMGRSCALPGSDGLQLWFSHRGVERFRAAGGDAYRLQRALSADGRRWQRDASDLAWSPPPAPGDWDEWMQAYPCVLPWRDGLVMFYNGNDFGRGGFGWAVSRAS